MNILESYGERIAVNSVKPNTMKKTHGASQCWCYRPCQGVITGFFPERGHFVHFIPRKGGTIPERGQAPRKGVKVGIYSQKGGNLTSDPQKRYLSRDLSQKGYTPTSERGQELEFISERGHAHLRKGAISRFYLRKGDATRRSGAFDKEALGDLGDY